MENIIYINRKWFTTKSTMGVLTIPELGFECYTLESVARPNGIKIFGETCIPAGKYQFKLTTSGRFKQLLPIIYNKSGQIISDHYNCIWHSVRIFGLNPANEEVDGCIQIGFKKGENHLYESKKAINQFMVSLMQYCDIESEYGIYIINNQNSIT